MGELYVVSWAWFAGGSVGLYAVKLSEGTECAGEGDVAREYVDASSEYSDGLSGARVAAVTDSLI